MSHLINKNSNNYWKPKMPLAIEINKESYYNKFFSPSHILMDKQINKLGINITVRHINDPCGPVQK